VGLRCSVDASGQSDAENVCPATLNTQASGQLRPRAARLGSPRPTPAARRSAPR
jgi:hypothetical protein